MAQTFGTGEVGKLLGVQAQTVRKWCEQGKIAAYQTSRPAGHWRITRKALEEYAEENEIPLHLAEISSK